MENDDDLFGAADESEYESFVELAVDEVDLSDEDFYD